MIPESISPGMLHTEAGGGNTATLTIARDAISNTAAGYAISDEQAPRKKVLNTVNRASNMRKKSIVVFGLVVLVLVPLLIADAQQPKKVGYLSRDLHPEDSRAGVGKRVTSFWDGLRQLGNVEGENITFEFHYTEERLARLSSLAKEPVGRSAVSESSPNAR